MSRNKRCDSVAMMGQGMVEETLGRLKALGINIAIDDFGTGLSSLSYLYRLPLDRVKIDRAFVLAMDSEGDGQRIAELVVKLGHSLNLQVIAEGVENETQVMRLRELGCHEAQGFLYGRPMEEKALWEWLRNRGDKRT